MRYGVLLLLAALIGLTDLVHRRVDERRADAPAERDLVVLPPPGYLKVMSAGYREAFADLIWVRALVFSGERLGQSQLGSVSRYVDGINTLAPRFRRPYLWGGITSIYGGTATIERPMIDAAVSIYRRGLAQHPEDHELLYALGMLLTHQVRSVSGYTPGERDALRAEGVEYIRRAAAYGADPLVRRYAATLLTEDAADELAIQFLESQLVETEDDEHRRLLRRKLSELVGTESTAEIERVREQFRGEHLAAWPYIPDTVYAVIRPEPGPLREHPPGE